MRGSLYLALLVGSTTTRGAVASTQSTSRFNRSAGFTWGLWRLEGGQGGVISTARDITVLVIPRRSDTVRCIPEMVDNCVWRGTEACTKGAHHRLSGQSFSNDKL